MRKFNQVVLILAVAAFGAVADTVSDPTIKQDVITNVKFENEAMQLGLTLEDVKKYHDVMDSPSGLYYKRGEANPYFVLSAEAKTEAERMKYARLWVKAEKGFIDKVGDAMRAYSKASVEEFGTNPKIWDLTSYDKLVNGFNQTTQKNQSRATLFIKAENCSDCVDRFQQLNNQLTVGIISGIDVYFADAKGKADSTKINKWAAAQNISPNTVTSKKITLNYAVDFMPDNVPSVMIK